jgi:hypothetical protein
VERDAADEEVNKKCREEFMNHQPSPCRRKSEHWVKLGALNSRFN